MLQPGSPAEHGDSARGAGTEPHSCLVNFQASAPTARDAPRGCHVARLGRVWGSRRVSPGNRGSSSIWKSFSSSPRRPHLSFSLSYLASRL